MFSIYLGHKSIKSTEIYINIEHSLFEAGANDQFTVRIAEKPEEIKELLEAGFEYVCAERYVNIPEEKKMIENQASPAVGGDFQKAAGVV